MKKIAAVSIAVLALAACGKDNGGTNNGTGGNTASITVDFTVDKEKAYTEEEVTFTSTVNGGKAPYTYVWSFGEEGVSSVEANPVVSYKEPGVKVVTLDVTDADGNKAIRPKSKTFTVEAAPIEDKGEVKLAWFVEFNDLGGGVRGSAPAIDDAGNVYLVTSVDAAGQLRKVSADGQLLKSVAINPAPGNSCMSASIDSKGNIYAGGGSGAGGSFHKYSADLSDLWAGEFWNKGSAASPKIWYGAAVQVNDQVVLVGNAGSTGTTGAISKEDGKRISWVISDDENPGGPSGGCRQSPAVSKDGYVWQVCAANGVIGKSLSALVSGGAAVYDFFAKDELKGSTDRAALAVTTVGGKGVAVGTSKPGVDNMVFRIDQEGKFETFEINETNTSIANATNQDQGAVVIGTNGEAIVNLKAGAVADGGLVAVDPATMTLAWEYRIPESVSGGAAVAKDGLVAFGTDKGSFYIIRPDLSTKGAELVAKADIVALAREAGMTFSTDYENPNIKMWSSLTIGDDGKMYIGFQKVDETTQSGLLCLTNSFVTGPGESCWPMFGVDRKHTGVQK